MLSSYNHICNNLTCIFPEGLRKRIATLFLQYCKTPLFNPEAARLIKVVNFLNCIYVLLFLPDEKGVLRDVTFDMDKTIRERKQI
jgi:hypothetical protein